MNFSVHTVHELDCVRKFEKKMDERKRKFEKKMAERKAQMAAVNGM